MRATRSRSEPDQVEPPPAAPAIAWAPSQLAGDRVRPGRCPCEKCRAARA